MFSVVLRQRTEPTTAAPWARAHAARWLPTNPVTPVTRIRIRPILLHSQHLAVERVPRADHLARVELAARAHAILGAQRRARGRIAREPGEGRRHRVDVPGKEPGRRGRQHLAVRRDVARAY